MKKVGLALGGGAARGLAHIGVLEVFEEAKIPVDMIAGTSFGGMVGALRAQGKDPGLMKEIALKINVMKMLSLADLTLPKSGLFGGKAVINLLHKIMGDDARFDELPIPLALVATDIITGEEVVIDQGSVLEGVRATISIPGIFTVAKWRGRYLVDGGLVNPVPVSTVRQMGADLVIAVNVIPPMGVRIQPAKTKEPSIFQAMLHSLYIATYSLVRSNLAGADIVIEPRLPNIGYGDFQRVDEAVRQGEIAAKELVEQIKQQL